MTTLVAFATRDCIVLGCDSLGTVAKPMLDPVALLKQCFDKKGAMKIGPDGLPVLSKVQDLAQFLEQVPYNQLPDMTKIFSLFPAKIGLLFAGAAIIGTQSIREIVEDFIDDNKPYLRSASVKGVSERLFDFIKDIYETAYATSIVRPYAEVLVAGYSSRQSKPEIYRLEFPTVGDATVERIVDRGEYTVVFGGQYDVISRVVNGHDPSSMESVTGEAERVVNEYRNLAEKALKKQGHDIELPPLKDFYKQISPPDPDRWAQGLDADLANYPEQAAIDLVDFLVDIMIKSQQFSSRLPTVGGDIHIAMITKRSGFRWISDEKFLYRGRDIPKYDDA